MNIPRPGGRIKSAAPSVAILRTAEVDEDGNEVAETEKFWLVDGQGQILEGVGPFSSAKEAAIARRAYLRSLGYGT